MKESISFLVLTPSKPTRSTYRELLKEFLILTRFGVFTAVEVQMLIFWFYTRVVTEVITRVSKEPQNRRTRRINPEVQYF
jgi:hypothetical protein